MRHKETEEPLVRVGNMAKNYDLKWLSDDPRKQAMIYEIALEMKARQYENALTMIYTLNLKSWQAMAIPSL